MQLAKYSMDLSIIWFSVNGLLSLLLLLSEVSPFVEVVVVDAVPDEVVDAVDEDSDVDDDDDARILELERLLPLLLASVHKTSGWR